MLTDISGNELLKSIKQSTPETQVIMVSGKGTIDLAVEAMKMGAFDFMTKPYSPPHLLSILDRARAYHDSLRENKQLKSELRKLKKNYEIVGSHQKIKRINEIIENIAPSESTVLIQGRSGTGKELVARAIHNRSSRAEGPFQAVNCGVFTETLIENELFGHEKGAFTDAVRAKAGAFELADGGTIFLDEIGELASTLQPKLLRALDQREVKRVGADQTVKVDVRVVAATNRKLGEEVKAGRFREDLYYRLSVVTVFMPPLRRRKEDIETIASHLLSGLAADVGKKLTGLSPEAAEALRAYTWPGNVRELRNVLGRAAALSDGGVIQAKDLFLSQGKRSSTLDGLSGKTLEEIEKAAIKVTLRAVDGNKTAAAKALGIAYSTLYEKMKKYGMQE